MAIVRLNPAGDIGPDLRVIDGADYVRQKVISRLRFFLGEWFLDQREGVPYYRDVLVKNPDLGVIRSVFRRVVAQTPGVLAVRKLDVSLDNRQLTVSLFAVADDNEPIIIRPRDRVFIVQV